MYPRVALTIVGLFLAIFVVLFVRSVFVAQQTRAGVRCERGVKQPYEQLLAHMSQLAEAGKTEELRTLIAHARDRSDDIDRVCSGIDENAYVNQVRELTR